MASDTLDCQEYSPLYDSKSLKCEEDKFKDYSGSKYGSLLFGIELTWIGGTIQI